MPELKPNFRTMNTVTLPGVVKYSDFPVQFLACIH